MKPYCQCANPETFVETFKEYNFDGIFQREATEKVCLDCHKPVEGTYERKKRVKNG